MQIFNTAVLATLVFASSSVQQFTSGPSAYIHNYCDFDVNVWSVVAGDPGTKITIPALGGLFNETFRAPVIGGVSLKMTPEDNCNNPTPITQLEYTSKPDFIWYDISDINCVNNGCPFKKFGMYMHSGDGCPTVSCTKGAICSGAYNAWDDNHAALACAAPADVHIYLCRDKKPLESEVLAAISPITNSPVVAKRRSFHLPRIHARSF